MKRRKCKAAPLPPFPLKLTRRTAFGYRSAHARESTVRIRGRPRADPNSQRHPVVSPPERGLFPADVPAVAYFRIPLPPDGPGRRRQPSDDRHGPAERGLGDGLRRRPADLPDRGLGPDGHRAGAVRRPVQYSVARAQPVRDPGGARLRVLPPGPDTARGFLRAGEEAPVRRAGGTGEAGRELPAVAGGRRRARELPEAACG